MHTPESLMHLVSDGSLHSTQSAEQESLLDFVTASKELFWDVMHRSSALIKRDVLLST